MEDFDEELENILYMCREVCVYKIPPLKANEGHRANDWGDLGKPLWKGRLRFVEKGETATLKFEDPNTGQVFAQAPYDPQKASVEAVLDSSRYFVVRVEDKGKKAYIGMGYVERSDSFDFNVALQDYRKRFFAKLNPPSPTTEKSPDAPAAPKKDYTLKDGQTFTIKIPGREKSDKESDVNNLLGFGGSSSSSSSSSSSTAGGAFPLLPPPPSAPKKRS
ncbi:adaptin ear-binding coat-associated protein 1 NECAP-1 [Schizopora paradoxa]|uniref:Adaptin ear-binding coat-associated protein 1 NECAP-1 n=1 Tax=Schizopora paradoxa TaxID=27342 RepID=A0A0H2S4N5_9AGAM|nr:adaptin ear-binding coat-associated protein 1 NECAP-1 [Schizopora paradoxa]